MAVNPISKKTCAVCNLADLPEKSRCSRCQKIWYCSQKCQKKDWPTHQLSCRSVSTIISPYFLKVEGKDLGANHRVLMLGTCHDVELAKYPKGPIEEIKKCDLLVTEFLVRLTVVEDVGATIRQVFMEKRGLIQSKFLEWDEAWLRLRLQELDYQESWLPILRQKSIEIKDDQKQWLSYISQEMKEKIQNAVQDYNINLSTTDPFFIENVLSHKITIRERNIKTAEYYLVKFFQSQGRPIIELDDEEDLLLSFMGDLLDCVKDYSLQECLKDIDLHLQEIATGEALKYENAYVGIVNNRDSFDFNAFKQNNELDPVDIRRNRKWTPKVSAAIRQYRSVGCLWGYDHFRGESGMVQSMEREGLVVRHVTRADLKTV